MLGDSTVAFLPASLMKAIDAVPRFLSEKFKGTCSLEQLKTSKHGVQDRLADGSIWIVRR